MRVQSCKAKGRRLQQEVCKKLVDISNGLTPDDIRSTSMGAPGEDIQMSSAARQQFPWSIECKNVEKLSIWSAIEQARENKKNDEVPVVMFKKNHEETHVAMPLEYFLKIFQDSMDKQK